MSKFELYIAVMNKMFVIVQYMQAAVRDEDEKRKRVHPKK